MTERKNNTRPWCDCCGKQRAVTDNGKGVSVCADCYVQGRSLGAVIRPDVLALRRGRMPC